MLVRELNALRQPLDALGTDDLVENATTGQRGARDAAERCLGVVADQVQRGAAATFDQCAVISPSSRHRRILAPVCSRAGPGHLAGIWSGRRSGHSHATLVGCRRERYATAAPSLA